VHKHTYYVQLLDDITKRKKLQEYQNTFVKVAAHDIRSPLLSIHLMCDLLARKAKQHTHDDLKVVIQSLQVEVARADRLVSTLLDISLFESGKVKLRLGQVRMRMLIDEVIEHVRRLAPSQRFSARSFDDISVYADRERIRQVLINLLENTIKYGSGRHPVIISVVQNTDDVVVSVLDRGPGIAKEAAARIFQPFYRTDHAKKAKIAGHGLGLHIAHKIVQAHHGRIWVEPRKGGGSVFSFTLPLKDHATAASFPEPEAFLKAAAVADPARHGKRGGRRST
jgi:signal transduction histidine kinase